jgi:hypothetical protein
MRGTCEAVIESAAGFDRGDFVFLKFWRTPRGQALLAPVTGLTAPPVASRPSGNDPLRLPVSRLPAANC